MVAILYNIRSVHNVGSIFRTADAAGLEKLYLCGVTPSPLDRFGKKRQDFVKVSLGSEDSVAWEKIGSSLRVDRVPPIASAVAQGEAISLIERLKVDGHTIISLEQHKTSVPYSNKLTFRKDVALVVGNEIEGLPQKILDISDHIIEIPVRGTKESLNVSVSFGIAAFELKKDRE